MNKIEAKATISKNSLEFYKISQVNIEYIIDDMICISVSSLLYCVMSLTEFYVLKIALAILSLSIKTILVKIFKFLRFIFYLYKTALADKNMFYEEILILILFLIILLMKLIHPIRIWIISIYYHIKSWVLKF